MTCLLSLQGPKDTPFEGGVFEVVLKVPQQYPLVAPAVRFKTKIFHPNVHFKVQNGPLQLYSIAFISCAAQKVMQEGLLWRSLPDQCSCMLLKTGEICLDILKTAWSPAWTLQSVCQAIIALMSDSAPDSPLNCDAGNLLRANDIRGYNSLARLYTMEHAMRGRS